MRRSILGLAAVLPLLLLWSCTNKAPAEKPHATVVMRDGTQVTGSVLASSPKEITLAGDDNVTRTIPMTQVRSVDYGEAPAAQTGAPAAGGREPPTSAGRAAPEAFHERHYHPEPSAIRTTTYELPVATAVSVRTEETIDSAKAVQGQTYAAEVSKDVLDGAGNVVIPRGSNAQIIIRSASKGGRFRGASDLVLDLRSVSVAGQEYQLETVDVAQRGKSGLGVNKRTGEYTGGGAALGAIIGAIAGQGKGAAIGAASGAGAGALTQILTKGDSIRVPVETVLTFKLEKPLRVVAAR